MIDQIKQYRDKAIKLLTKQLSMFAIEARDIENFALFQRLMNQILNKGLFVDFFVHRAPKDNGNHKIATSSVISNVLEDGTKVPVSRGIALCSARDRWDKLEGVNISLKRALRALNHKECAYRIREEWIKNFIVSTNIKSFDDVEFKAILSQKIDNLDHLLPVEQKVLMMKSKDIKQLESDTNICSNA